VDTLVAGVADLELDGHALCGGAKELLDFAVVTTLAGAENPHAGTDLSDMAARVEGSQAAVEAMRPLLTQVDPALLATIDRRFAELRTVLDTHRSGTGYVGYERLTPAQLSELAHALDAVGEPVSKLGGTVMV
jgi:iron uptake system component EfeO